MFYFHSKLLFKIRSQYRRIPFFLLLCPLLLSHSLSAPIEPIKPIVPTVPNSATYQWKHRVDVPLLATALGATLGAHLKFQSLKTPSPSEWKGVSLLPLDRPYKGVYSRTAADWSNYLSLTAAAPLMISGISGYPTKNFKPLWIDFVMLTEALSLSSALNLWVRASLLKPRPFVYSAQAPTVDKNKPEAFHSFYSGHSSAAFLVATFTGTTFQHRHPKSRWVPWVWTGSMTLASSIAGLRVWAGKHYPTDILVGALVGSAFGYLIPQLHQHREKRGLSLNISPKTASVQAYLKW